MDNREGVSQTISSQQLTAKYRLSWQQATDVQRVALCNRFGVRYTHVGDEALLSQIAQKQQEIYTASKKQAALTKLSFTQNQIDK